MNNFDPPRRSASRPLFQTSDPPPKIAGVIEPYPAPESDGTLHSRRVLTRVELWILGVLAALPLLAITLRILVLPGFASAGGTGFWAIGSVLNQFFSLSDVPADQRDHVLYLLFVPTCALLVALARLTLGMRVLGFRSILIAVAFHQSGVLPSLLLIAVAVITVLLLRPWLRRIRLPYYARVSVILCVVSVTMVGALLVGPWMRSDIAWGMAYFPVIVLGMLAEGIARTVDRDNVVKASWLAFNTVLLAFVMALICQVPVLRSFILRFPEIVVTQVVAIVMVAKYLDLRLLQNWHSRIARTLLPRSPVRDGWFRVAVVRNRVEPGEDLHGATSSHQALRSVQKIVNALRHGGYTVRVVEGDTSLLRQLRRFFTPDTPTGERYGMVLNLAQGTHGDARTTHVPALLEMSGIPYSGPTPLGHAMLFDRVVTKSIMKQAGIPTPEFWLLSSSTGDVEGLSYPAIVRPRHAPGATPQIVADHRELQKTVKKILRRYDQDAFIEETVTGRQISVALLGNDPVECLPLVEVRAETRAKICPAVLEDFAAERIRSYARAAFRACGCRDYARVDICIGESGRLWVLEVRTLGVLAAGGSFVRAGHQAGYTFQDLICRIIGVARIRSVERESSRRQEDDRMTTSQSSSEAASWIDTLSPNASR